MGDTQAPKNSHLDDLETPERVYARSFVGEPPRRVWIPLALTTLFVLACTAVFVHDSLPSWLKGAEMVIWGVIIGAWLIVIFSWRTVWRIYVHGEHVWQAGLPFTFDGESYKETLSRRANWGRCVVFVDTGNDDDATNQKIAVLLRAEGVHELLDLGAGRFEVRSPMFDTVTDLEDNSLYSNERLHHWFKRYAQMVLVPLHAVGFVKTVRVESLPKSSRNLGK